MFPSPLCACLTVAVVISFFFCYSPFHAQRVLATNMHRFKITSGTIKSVYIMLTHISGVTYYLSATINPIIYQLLSQKFRIAFKDTFGYCIPCLSDELPEITYCNIGGASSYKLSRTGSYYSNGSFRRASTNFVDSPVNKFRKASSMNDFPAPPCTPSATCKVAMANNDQNRTTSVHNSLSDNNLQVPNGGGGGGGGRRAPANDGQNNSNQQPPPHQAPGKSQFLLVPSFKF